MFIDATQRFAVVVHSLSLLKMSENSTLHVRLQKTMHKLKAEIINKTSLQLLRSLSKALALASDALPFDLDLPGIQQEVADQMRSMSSVNKADDFQVALTKVVGGDDVDWTPLLTAVASTHSALEGSPLSAVNRTEMVRVVVVLVEHCVNHGPGQEMLNAIDTLVNNLPTTEHTHSFALLPPLHALLALDESFHALKQVACSPGDDEPTIDIGLAQMKEKELTNVLKALTDMRSAEKSVVEACAEGGSLAEAGLDSLVEQLQELAGASCATAKDVLNAVGGAKLTAALADLGPVYTTVSDLAKGLMGGEDWLSTIKPADQKSFATLHAFASKTLLQVKPVARLRPHIQSLMKA